MGFFASYRRLTTQQKVGIGFFGILIGIAGPFYTESFQKYFESQQEKENKLKENMRSAEEQRKEEARRQFKILKEKYERKMAEKTS